MKVAICADIHGNYHALEAILADLERERPDVIVSAGDMIGCSPYPSSPRVWQTLGELGIPKVLGNLEDFVIACHGPEPNPLIQTSVRFMPTQYVARQFTKADVEEMKALPMNLTINGPGGDEILVCHASPFDLSRSFAQGIDSQMVSDLNKIEPSTIVGGHLHRQWHQYWQGKLLILAGGGGLPLQGEHVAEYLVLTHWKGEWQFGYRTIPFDYQSAIDSVLESDFLENAGPIGWLMLDEVMIQRDHLMPFFHEYCSEPMPESWKGW